MQAGIRWLAGDRPNARNKRRDSSNAVTECRYLERMKKKSERADEGEIGEERSERERRKRKHPTRTAVKCRPGDRTSCGTRATACHKADEGCRDDGGEHVSERQTRYSNRIEFQSRCWAPSHR